MAQLTPDGHTLCVNKETIHIFTKLKSKEKQIHLDVQALATAWKKARKKTHTADSEGAKNDSDGE